MENNMFELETTIKSAEIVDALVNIENTLYAFTMIASFAVIYLIMKDIFSWMSK
tara:strand:+ start:267 stop:428 length:162 start_codon:yes stop_codon:yes gene_type:complete